MSTASATRNAGLAAAPRSVLAAPELSTQELLIVAQSIAADSARWEPRVHHDPFQRTYHEVARTDTHSAWLICALASSRASSTSACRRAFRSCEMPATS